MIHLTAKVDNEQAKRKFKELETSARNSIRGIETESKGMERSMGNLAKGIAAIGGAAAMTGLVKKMVEVRGEFQQLGIAFETMLGSKEKADNLMREAVEFAAKTPFTLTDVASNIKQLMAMGVAVENVMDTMKMLGDVAAGVSVPISRVAINYGQVLTMGKLQGRELRDFAMAGIPLVDELAKNLGVAKDEVQDLVSAGRVMADDVTEAFRTMSAEGGRFYNLMEKQNKSVTGQISNLKDRIEVMFNEMGTASEGAIYGVIKGAQYLVGHYKDIADILVPLIATFGAYKVALIAVAAAQRAVVSAKSISAFFSLAKSIHSAKDAMLLLNMSMNASTIGLVVAAIAALATTTTILIRRANEAAEAANRAKKAFKDETSELTTMIEVLNDSNMAYEERKRALDKIRDMVPDYHASLTQEGQLINNNTAAIDKYLESLEKEILMKTLYDDLEQAIQKRENLKDGGFLLSLIGVTGGKKAQQRIVDEAVAAVEDIKEKIKTASKGEDASILGPFLPEGFDRELGRIKEAGDLIKQARENVSDLAGELERVKTNPQQYENAQKWAAAIKEAEENLKDARDALAILTGGENEAYTKAQEAVLKIIGERWKDLKGTYNDISKYFRGEESDLGKEAFEGLEDAIRSADEALSEMDRETVEYAKTYDFLGQQASMIFADISELSSSMIRQIIANAEQYVSTNKNLTDEQIAEYRRAIDQANTYLVEKNPWDAIRVAQERYVKALKDYDAATEANDILAQNDAILEQASALNIVRQAYEQIGSIVRQFAGFGLDIAEMFGVDSQILSGIEQMVDGAVKLSVELADLLTKTKKVGEAAADVTKAAGSAAEKAGEGVATVGGSVASSGAGIAGAIIAIVGAVIQIGGAITQVIQGVKKQKLDEHIDSLNNGLESTKRLLQEIAQYTGMGDSIFTEDSFNRIRSINAALLEMRSRIQGMWKGYAENFPDFNIGGQGIWQDYGSGDGSALELSRDIQEQLIKVGGITDEFSAIYNIITAINKELFAFPTNGWGENESIFGNIDVENISKLLRLLQDTAAVVEDEELKAWAENAADMVAEFLAYYEDLKASLKDVFGDISSTILTNVNSMWKEIREGGEKTFADLTKMAKKDIAEVIDQMVSSQLWARVMGGMFDDLAANLAAVVVNPNFTNFDLLSVFDNFWVGMQGGLSDYTRMYEAFLQSAEAHGWDMGSGNTYDTEIGVAEGSIRAMRDELSKLQDQWENLSKTDREGLVGKQLSDDIIALQREIDAAESLYAEMKKQTELEALQALLDSAEAKYSLLQKWTQLYGKDTAEAMMGEMLEDAESYVDELRGGIADLTAKVAGGTATDEEIAQLEAWESQLEDIMDQGAQAAINAANEASQAWNDKLNEALEGAGTQYDRMSVLQNEYLSALEHYDGLDAGPMKDAAREYMMYLEGMLQDQSALIEKDLEDRYKTQEQANAETLKTFEDDLKYAREVLQDEDLVKEIERQRNEFLSEQAAAALEASEEYKLIFGDLTNISEEAFRDAMAKIKKSIEESTDLTDEAKAVILKNLDAIGAGFNDSLGEKRINKIKQSFDDLVSVMNDTVSLMQSLGAGDSAVQMLQGVIKVVEGYRDLKLAIEEAALAQTALSLSNVFTAIVAVINGLIMALSALGVKLVQLVDVDSISGLAEAYDKLTDAISRSVGAQRLQKQEAARQNLEQQKAEVERALAREKAKWGFTLDLGLLGKYKILGPDQGAVKEMEAQLSDLNKALDQLGDTMKQDYLQTDAQSFSSELANILTSQYDSYADMMADVEKLTQKTLNNITRQWLTAHFLENSIQDALDALYGGGKEPTAQAYEAFQRKVNEASENFMKEMDRMNLMFGSGETTSGTSNAGVISKSITENTATWIKGLMMNQNLELNEMNKNIQYIGKFSERTANGVEDLTRINSQIAQHTSVLPKMAQSMVSLAMDVSQIKNKVGLSRENIQ